MKKTALPEPSYIKLAELLGAFALASDLAFGLELEDGLRSTYMADRLAERMRLPHEERFTVYYTSLLKDAGCTCWTTPLAEFWQGAELEARRDLLIFGASTSISSHLAWIRRYVGAGMPLLPRLGRALSVFMHSDSFMHEGFASTAEVCVRFSKRLGLPGSVQAASANLFEQWNGKGEPRRISGEGIPIASQVIMPTFILAPVYRAAGSEVACQVAREGRGNAFAPRVVDAFLDLAESDEFWTELGSTDIQEIVLSREPVSAYATVGPERFDDVAFAFADFIDLKSPIMAAHSRRVARIAEQIGAIMGCTPEECTRLRRGGLMHDLGLVAIPSHILNRQDANLNRAEQEVLQLHPYHGERVLNRIAGLAAYAPMVGNHHERMDGKGYYRGIRARDLSLETRIIAVANRLDELTHDGAGGPARDVANALDRLAVESGDGLDPDIVRALASNLGAETPRRGHRPAGLTEREVEVLRLAARGLKRRDIGRQLSITESTVRHHLEHIYTKTGTSTRVGAILFAMENDLIV